MQIHVFQHIPFEDEAHIGVWAESRGHTIRRTRFFEDDPLPPVSEIDLLVITGGPMNVYDYDSYPWLYREKTHILDAIKARIPVVGLCLGAQLIADVMGGRVRKNPEPEIGWFPVELTSEGQRHQVCRGLPDAFTAMHWHGDTLQLPRGAVHLAATPTCRNQAFIYGNRVLGLQFHLEYTHSSLEAMLTHCHKELVDAPFVQSADAIRKQSANVDASQRLLERLLDNLVDIANGV